MNKIIIASNNAHKIDEIKNALSFSDCDFVSMKEAGFSEEVEENASTFEGNARLKAQAVYDALGCAVIADDSGLVVDALDGAPGVYSARFAGIHGDDARNNEKLLSELSNVPSEKRTARFKCALVFIDNQGKEISVEGTVEGFIAFEQQGEGGFGYDPLFMPIAYNGEKSFAELSQTEKTEISHRGNALKNLREALIERK